MEAFAIIPESPTHVIGASSMQMIRWLRRALEPASCISIRILLIWLVSSMLATAVLQVNERTYQQASAATHTINAARVFRAELMNLLLALFSAENALREVIRQSPAQSKEPYSRAISQIHQTLEKLQALPSFDERLSQSLNLLILQLSRKTDELNHRLLPPGPPIGAARRGVLPPDMALVPFDESSARIFQLIERIEQIEAQQQPPILRRLQLSRVEVGMMAIAAILALSFYFRQSLALRRADLANRAAVENERALLEGLIKERTVSLAQLATHLQQVTEQEKAYLARELHDELGALLTAAKLDVARIKSRLGEAVPETVQWLQHLGEILNSVMALKQRIVEDLHPSTLDHLGLLPALEILTREFGERSGLVVGIELDPVELAPDVQLTLYRLVQESLTNVGKYAQAQKITVELRNEADHLSLVVTDNGRGFDPSKVGSGAHGLRGMRHRIEAEGGRLSVESAPGQGTRITAQMPLRPRS
jgi:signal transduction histidine kinase